MMKSSNRCNCSPREEKEIIAETIYKDTTADNFLKPTLDIKHSRSNMGTKKEKQ